MFTQVVDLTEEIHTDQTGAFPHTSQRGNRYIMVAIHLDANYIFAEPMKNRTEGEMIRTYQKIINRMKAAGLPCGGRQFRGKLKNKWKWGGDRLLEEDQWMLEVPLGDVETTGDEQEEYWLLAIKAVWAASALTRAQTNTALHLRN